MPDFYFVGTQQVQKSEVELTDGNVVHYGYIEKFIESLG